jgi:hypothetical protein
LSSLQQNPDPTLQITALRAFLSSLVRHVLSAPARFGVSAAYSSAASFFDRLMHVRYQPHHSLYFCAQSAPPIARGQWQWDEKCLTSLSGSPMHPDDSGSAHADLALQRQALEQALTEAEPLTLPLAELFASYFTTTVSGVSEVSQWMVGVGDEVLGSFAEHCVHKVLGLQATCAFMRRCLMSPAASHSDAWL